MFTNRFLAIYLYTSVTLLALLQSAAVAQTTQPAKILRPFVVTRDQLQALMPVESDLQGFTRLKMQKFEPSQDMTGQESDMIELNQDVTQWFPGRPPTPKETGTISLIRRRYVSANNLYWVTIEISLRATPEAATKEVENFLHSVQAGYQPGTFSGASQIGDASYFSGEDALLFRCGRMMVYINGSLTWSATHQQNDVPKFPTSAMEAIAYQTLLLASESSTLTAVSSQTARVNIDNQILHKNGSLIAGRTYVPVAEFAKAMGLTSQWDTKTGALTLSGTGHKTVTLTAGSTAANVAGKKAAALSVPVLKQAGQPVMALDDLLTVTGGKITGHSGDTVQVKT